ncbi:MAG: DUF2240 family protein [Candidatus Lokiarchaeota archaeon]|nr:DUF2240 family protein [Candidatus Lokiarchaeota archaeon]MBD3201033.1 DUF2240 family protein [Candidatus Lokiarchaeota archaeon]
MKTNQYIKKIIEETGLNKKEIQQRVQRKKEELKGLISEEGALFIIAKELGVDVKDQNSELLEDIEIDVADVTTNMKNITITGRIKDIFRIHTFNRKDGSEGKVGSFLLHDQTGDIRVVMWDEKTEILKHPNFEINELIKIINSYAKEGKYGTEIHVGRLSKLIISPEDVDYKKYPKIKEDLKEIGNITLSDPSVNIEGKIMNKSSINEFEKKDGTLGKVSSLNIMDNTGTIRITFWNDDTDKVKKMKIGDVIRVFHLNPRQSNLDPNIIELFANKNTKIEQLQKSMDFNGEVIEKIEELQKRNDIVSFKGIISSIDNLKEVTLRSGESVSLLGFVISDETDGIRATLWRDQAKKYSEILEAGKGVFLKNVLIKYSSFSKRNEISLIKNSELEIIELDINNLKEIDDKRTGTADKFSGNYTKIKSIDKKGFYEVKGFIVKEINKITIYDSCSKCFRKVDNCKCDKIGDIEERMIFNLILDDGTDTIRTTFIGDKAEEILGKKTSIISEIQETPDFNHLLESISKELVGKDIIIRGKAKFSDFTNKYELVVYDFKFLNVSKELKRLMNEITT